MNSSLDLNVDSEIRLTPIVRLGMEFSEHLKGSHSNESKVKLLELIAAKYAEADAKCLKIVRSVAKIDLVLLLILATNLSDFSVFGVQFGKINFAMEVLLLASSFSFFFFVIAFINSQGYLRMLGVLCEQLDPADPEYLQSSYSFNELFLKIFRKQSTMGWRSRGDFFQPRLPFSIAANFVFTITVLATLMMPLTHFVLLSYGAIAILKSYYLGDFLSWFILIASFLLNFCGATFLVLSFKDFKFDIVFQLYHPDRTQQQT